MRELLAPLCAVVLAWPSLAVADESGGVSVTCRERRVSVALAPDRAADQTIIRPTPALSRR